MLICRYFRNFAVEIISNFNPFCIMAKFDFHLPFEGVFHLVGKDGSYVSFSAGYSSVSDALFDCKDWLYKRPDLCFVSFVVGAVVVASAGSFPFADSRIPLSPVGC